VARRDEKRFSRNRRALLGRGADVYAPHTRRVHVDRRLVVHSSVSAHGKARPPACASAGSMSVVVRIGRAVIRVTVAVTIAVAVAVTTSVPVASAFAVVAGTVAVPLVRLPVQEQLVVGVVGHHARVVVLEYVVRLEQLKCVDLGGILQESDETDV
jgi:hypothetical protein